jgi:hypothetical protein
MMHYKVVIKPISLNFHHLKPLERERENERLKVSLKSQDKISRVVSLWKFIWRSRSTPVNKLTQINVISNYFII